MLKTTLTAALLLAATGALAQEAAPQEVEAPFTWSTVDAAPTLPMGDGQEAYMADIYVVLSAAEGPLAGLAGRCMVIGVAVLATSAERNSGTCVYVDAKGDQLWKRIEGEGNGAPFRGHGTFIGGTGRFEGASGEVDYDTSFSGSLRTGVYQGMGINRGTLTLAGS
ncbi:hypothetical protein [Rubellimicrobium aerolatum]|uniref:Uncharacterized protein n=1 Tax=Rubellimicrobium aerolatum TaxID=490979 RepID=A0ABW0SAR1_9RHOB|nr:hypothetical protein [Rubellimicrobium aerolatum]MBP1805315.1 hypothetical protein [Rubellimicrobium aerolatum]